MPRPRTRPLLFPVVAVLAVLGHGGPLLATPAPDWPPGLAIDDVTVVDVAAGRLLPHRDVRVEGERIVAVRAAAPSRDDGAEHLDGRGRFLIPGLVDLHVHLFNHASGRAPNEWMLLRLAERGVTAVREMNARSEDRTQITAWNDEVAAGARVAPRIVAAGIALRPASVEPIAAQVDTVRATGFDFLKVFSELPVADWRAAVAEARRAKLPLLGHVPATVALREVADAGQRDVEHLTQAFEACSTVEDAVLAERRALVGDAQVAKVEDQESAVLAAYDAPRCRRIARLLAARGIWQVPTLVLPHVEATRGDRHPYDDPRFVTLRADEQARWHRILDAAGAEDGGLAQRRRTVALAIVGVFHAAGVPFAAGTDSPMPEVYPGDALHDELALLVEAGLSPAEALRAATLSAHQLLGDAGTAGRIAAGQRADLVLLADDPLQRIEHTRGIVAVVIAGRHVVGRRAPAEVLPTEDLGPRF